MPFNPNDAARFKKSLTDNSVAARERWSRIANMVLQETGSEDRAISTANSVSKGSIVNELKRRKGLGSPYG